MIVPVTSLSESQLSGRTVIMRVDFNVPLKQGQITDSTRIDRVLPGIEALAAKGARLILASHLGRPGGKPSKELSLAPVCAFVARATGRDISLLASLDAFTPPPAGAMVMLENLRFWPEEEANNADFAARLAGLADIYVNDAFSCAHRAHASTEGLARLLPAYAGPSLARELDALDNALEAPQRPVAAVVGGAKVSTKLDVLTHLTGRVDHLLLGGGMANTFLAAAGHGMGRSLLEAELVGTARQIMQRAEQQGCCIHLPVDALVARQFAAGAAHRTAEVGALAADEMMLDIGPASIAAYEAVLCGVRTVLWNGPMGAFEIPPFDTATCALARTAAAYTVSGQLVSVAGGGDTVAALNHAGCTEKFSYVSLAGGAFLESIEGRVLPGIAALEQAH